MSEEKQENKTTENTTEESLVEMVYALQDSIESMLLAGCGDCGWEGPFWRLGPGSTCPNCESTRTMSAYEANAIDEQGEQGQENP